MDEVVFRGSKFSVVRRSRVVGGRTAVGEYIVHPGAIAVLALVDGEALLVRQFRGALGERTLEIPAGSLEPGERPEETAIREMVEETGYKPLRLEPLLDFYPTPGVSNERIWVFFTDKAEHVGVGDRDAEEADMEVVRMRPRDVLAMVDRGEIKDGKTILAFLAAYRKGLI
ncbi:MAG: NUDIX hydrolase [Thermoproteus sp.]